MVLGSSSMAWPAPLREMSTAKYRSESPGDKSGGQGSEKDCWNAMQTSQASLDVLQLLALSRGLWMLVSMVCGQPALWVMYLQKHMVCGFLGSEEKILIIPGNWRRFCVFSFAGTIISSQLTIDGQDDISPIDMHIHTHTYGVISLAIQAHHWLADPKRAEIRWGAGSE